MEIAFVSAAVVGVTEFVKRVREHDTVGASHIAVAAVVGVAAGLVGIAGLTVVTGLLAGLSAAGIHTVATRIG